MKKRIYSLFIALVLSLACASAFVALGQTRRASGSAQVKPSLLSALPASDAVMQIDVQRLLNDALPRIYANDSAKMAQINAEIDKFKTQTGIDARSFDRVVLGARFIDLENGKTKVETVALAHGTFKAATIVAAGRLAAQGKYREQKYNGATIYIFNINDQVKLLGLLDIKVSELAVSALDASTLAIGDADNVRAATDSRNGRARVANALVQLASRNAGAIIGFGANLPSSVTQGLNVPNDEIARNIASIRQVYGSLGTVEKGFDAVVFARTENADQARGLSETIAALKQFAPLISGRVAGPKGKLARNALESLQVSAQGNELQLRLSLAQTDIAALLLGR
ncbi:MAG TPA: hypothetical protein VGB17_10720 [Pyrinomonadaceae bacterium]